MTVKSPHPLQDGGLYYLLLIRVDATYGRVKQICP